MTDKTQKVKKVQMADKARKEYDVIIIGAGPAGIFTALELTNQKPGARVLMADMGKALERRNCPMRTLGRCAHCDPCAIVYGWAGAGAFSDGKLSLSPEVGGQITDYVSKAEAESLIARADAMYLRFGAPDTVHGQNDAKVDELRYEASRHNIRLIPCPVRHLGTDRAGEVLGAMYGHLTQNTNTEFLECAEALDLLVEQKDNGEQKIGDEPQMTGEPKISGKQKFAGEKKITGVTIRQNGETMTVRAPFVVVAPGRGGAAWLTRQMHELGFTTKNNEVDIGVRVEVPNAVMDHITRHLYEAKLVYYADTYENRVRTFCMNPGGVVSEEHYEGGIAAVNGHSYAEPERRTENTNFAILVSTHFTEPFDQPIEYGRYIAKLANMLTGGPIMVQRLGDLLQGRRTDITRLRKSTTIPTLPTAVPGDLSFVIPSRHLTSIVEAIRAFDKLAPGLYSRNTLLYGVEVKFYSTKVRVGSRFETEIGGLYAIGDGAGITRGLMQASCTGIVVAGDIAERL